MTVSTNAILFFGYCWDENTRRPWRIGREGEVDGGDPDEDGWEDRYARARGARARGVLAPAVSYPERTDAHGRAPADYTPEEQAAVDAHHAYWEQRRDLAEASPCEISSHCSQDCPMPYVFVRASWVLSSRGSMTEVRNLAVDPAWVGQLAEFCEVLGIRTDGLRPTWWLVSDWSAVAWRRDAPPRGVRCLVTTLDATGDRRVMLASVSLDHEGAAWFSDGARLHVVAWMPLPEAARAGQS